MVRSRPFTPRIAARAIIERGTVEGQLRTGRAVTRDLDQLMQRARAVSKAARVALWRARVTAAMIERELRPRYKIEIALGLGDDFEIITGNQRDRDGR